MDLVAMLNDTGNLAEAFGRLLTLVGLVSIRLLAVLYMVPATGPQFIQGALRGAIGVELGLFVAFGLPADAAVALSATAWFGLALKEALLGLVIGFAASTVFWTAECAGALFDTQAGYNNVQLTNPMSDQQSTPVSAMLMQFVVAVFYMVGGLSALCGLVFESYHLWPPTQALPSMGRISEALFVQQMDSMMTAVLKTAAPVLVILMLIDLGFGLVTRAADKLEPSSLSQPVKGAVTMLLLALLVGLFVEQVRRFLLPVGLLQHVQTMLG